MVSGFVPEIAVNDRACKVLAGLAFGLESGTDFTAGISGVILVEQRLFGKGKDKQAEIQYSCGFVAGWLPKS